MKKLISVLLAVLLLASLGTAALAEDDILDIDTEGNPIKGVAIQFCDDSTCNLGKTDANGVANFDMPEGTQYEVHVLKVPEGYEKTSDEFRTLDVYSDLVIVLNAAA